MDRKQNMVILLKNKSANFVTKYIFELNMDQNYKGLSNIGATCYMNSLLQTLYMTPEFKEAVYQWQYNERIHPKPEDSILFQLQKLFGKLDQRFPGEVSTRDLVKSFQWDNEEAQMQQDIQEFNRVLFEALEKSLKNKKNSQDSGTHFVRDLYEGEMMHYTHCLECNNESQKEECFQDLILTVKNPFQKIYNNCIELGLQRYMKPEVLDKDNLYKCEACGKMVQAQRGVRLLRMPKLLNIILRRFDFDYFTFQRIKINDRVQFPHILNINNYMQGYNQIQNKLNEDNSAYFIEKEPARKPGPPTTGSTTSYKKVTKKNNVPSVAGKVMTKPSANTKSFLAQMRKNKNMSADQNEDLVFVSGNYEMKSEESKKVNETIVSSTPTNNPENTPAKQPQQQDETKKQQAQLPPQAPPTPQLLLPPPLTLIPPSISQPFSKPCSTPSTASLSLQQQLQSKISQKQALQSTKSDTLQHLQLKNQQQISEYLKEGQLVYQLYAVMVHNGNATHGHYYSYIKDNQTGRWFCFNDDRVSEINVEEVQKSFGGTGSANAYALYYRQVAQETDHLKDLSVTLPTYILRALQEQEEIIRRRQKEKAQNLENVLVLKIYYQLAVKVLQINKSSTMELVCLKAREMFDIPESVPIQNSRVRIFNPVSDTKLQTFTGREQESLQSLKIGSYKNLVLELKKDSEQFEEYVVGKMPLRVAFWPQPQAPKFLDQLHLHLHKISVSKDASMIQVQEAIKQKIQELGLDIQNVCVVKRHQNDEYSYHEVINLGENRGKDVVELMVLENQILFVEQQQDINKLNWPIQFENEVFRIGVKYINGDTGSSDTLLTDSRNTLLDLKTTLCTLLSLDPSQTIMKRGTKSGLELKNLCPTLKQSRFISGTQVYLQKGLPAKQGEIRIQLFIATDADIECYNRLHEFQFIADVPINGQCKASEVKEIFCGVLKKYRNLEIKSDEFWIREKVCDKIGKIYRERPMKQQQLIEKRQIAIQMHSGNIDDKQYLAYVRIWNPEQWRLSKKMSINVSKTTTMKDLANLIFALNQEVSVEEMEICRILSLNKFGILDLCEMEYFPISQASVFAEPLFVNADGLVFVVKNAKKIPRPLSLEEQNKFGGNVKLSAKVYKGRSLATAPAKKQKGVTIKVVENNEEQQKQNASQQQQPAQ